MKIKIFLHNGDAKTGTSIIQNFLDVNRMNLFKNHNCLYPNFKFPSNLADGRCHNHAVWYKNIKEDRKKIDSEISNLIDFAQKQSIEKVILSNEAWFLQEDDVETLANISNRWGHVQLITISYLRRIDYWCESAWKQWGLKVYDSIDEYTKLNMIQGRFKGILKHLNDWEQIIGLENVIVRPYEKQQLPKGLVYDFITKVGLDYDSSEWQDPEEKNIALNRGFNRDVLELLHCCRGLFTDVHDNHLFDLFSELLSDKFIKKPFEKYDLLSPEQRLKIINKNLCYEKEIAKKYMCRENDRIFLDPMPELNENWEPYKGLTIEKVIPIIIDMIDGTYQKITTMQKKINRPKK